MPEGPEVEAARKLVANNLLRKKIVKAIVADDAKVFMARSPQEVAQALEGRTLTAARRKAKYLWFELDGEGPMPLLHFGMTGSVLVQGVGAAKYKRVKADESDWPPKFCKLELQFEGGACMAFTDPRRFGRVQLLDSPATQEPVSKLGFDVIDELPPLDDFRQRFAAYQKPGSALRVKALLLDQAFTAGVGNWVADEVLYQARVHPEQPVADMTPEQIQAVHEALQQVLQLAVSVDADSDRFPPDWLFHFRWTGKKASSVGGHAVSFVTVGSRTSAFVPALQKIIAGTGLSKLERSTSSKRGGKRKAAAEEEEGPDDMQPREAAADDSVPAAKRSKGRRSKKATVAVDDEVVAATTGTTTTAAVATTAAMAAGTAAVAVATTTAVVALSRQRKKPTKEQPAAGAQEAGARARAKKSKTTVTSQQPLAAEDNETAAAKRTRSKAG